MISEYHEMPLPALAPAPDTSFDNPRSFTPPLENESKTGNLSTFSEP